MRHRGVCLLIIFYLRDMTSMQPIDSFSISEKNNVFASNMDASVMEQDDTRDCKCYTTNDHVFLSIQCRCYGKIGKNLQIVENWNESLHGITISDSIIEVIQRDLFQTYKATLEDVTLNNMKSLRVIEKGTFRDIPNLRTLYISHCPQIKFLNGVFEGATTNKFLSLRIVQTSLHEIPDLSYLQTTDRILHMIDLEGNKIERVPSNTFRIRADQVTLNYNEITTVEDFAFNGSQIGKLSLAGNKQLTTLKSEAFSGLSSLQQLDLSETAIEYLPVDGLSEIEVLKIERAPTMKVIPSIYDFPYLKEAHLTHPFHCCAFEYPEQHDPDRHKKYEEKIKKACQEQEQSNAFDTGQKYVRKKRSNFDSSSWGDEFDFSSYGVPYEEKSEQLRESWIPSLEDLKAYNNKSDFHVNPLQGEIFEHQEGREFSNDNDIGTFHEPSADISKTNKIHALCGTLSIRESQVKCYPEPNALNPCEDIMGSYYLRVSVWFVVILAVIGNLAVIVVVFFSGGEITVSRFLICNLAFADFCMGLYLLLIASMDLHSVGTYFNFAFDWQYGIGCQLAGFLTMFASQLSIFTLTVVTVERWFAITYAVYLTRRIKLSASAKIMIFGWIYSILMAAIPLLGVSNYSSTSICLPMEVNREADKAYLITIIIINGLAFGLIVFCYAQIYFSLAYETRRSSTKGEMTIAKKMALLVFTDFACWAPIAFFALTALAGYPLIGVTRSKILLVFFYPLNSCANPYLYAIMTAQYRRDFFILLGRCGICKSKASQYTLSTSLPTTNNSHPIPLIARMNGRKSSVKTTQNFEDAFV